MKNGWKTVKSCEKLRNTGDNCGKSVKNSTHKKLPKTVKNGILLKTIKKKNGEREKKITVRIFDKLWKSVKRTNKQKNNENCEKWWNTGKNWEKGLENGTKL